jgi:hypothetical protein
MQRHTAPSLRNRERGLPVVELSQFREEFRLRPLEELVLRVAADLYDRDVGEADVDDLRMPAM